MGNLTIEFEQEPSWILLTEFTTHEGLKCYVFSSLESKVEMSKAEVNRALWDKNNVQAALEDEIKRCKLELADLREK